MVFLRKTFRTVAELYRHQIRQHQDAISKVGPTSRESRTIRLRSQRTAPRANAGPVPPITLRQGARVIEDSRRLRVV
jgi:hypothetical protein